MDNNVDASPESLELPEEGVETDEEDFDEEDFLEPLGCGDPYCHTCGDGVEDEPIEDYWDVW